MDLLLLDDDYKSNYVYIKDFDKFMFHKTKKTTKKEKNGFVKVFYSALVMKVLTELKEDCLSINGKQSVKLEKEIIEFEIYLKKIPVPVKIYADFQCNLRNLKIYEGSYTKKYQYHIPCSFAHQVVCIDGRLTKPFVVYRSENAAYEFIKAIPKEYRYSKKVINKHFNKNLIMAEKEEHLFQKSKQLDL